jgi:hypothetical protein
MLITAGGKIVCLRCTAISKRTGLRCGAPAEKPTDKIQLCRFHGARSTGPRTEEGIQRIREANTTHGKETKEARVKRAESLVKLAHLQDVMTVLDMHVGTRTRGPKPRGYKKIETVDAAYAWLKTEK